MDVTKPYEFIKFVAMDVTKPCEYVTVSLRRFDRSVFQHVLFFENAISMLESTTDGPLCRRNPTPFTHDSGWWENTPGSNLCWYDRPAGPTGRADWPGREVVLNIMKVWTRGRPSTLWKGLSMYR